MSRFYASIQGNRGEATRSGSKDSGIHGHIRGWHVGAQINVNPDWASDEEKYNEVQIHITGGSAGFGSFLLAIVKETDEGKEVTVNTPDGPVVWTM